MQSFVLGDSQSSIHDPLTWNISHIPYSHIKTLPNDNNNINKNTAPRVYALKSWHLNYKQYWMVILKQLALFHKKFTII